MKELNETVYKDQPDHQEFARFYLVQDAVKLLNGEDQIEQRKMFGGKEEVRLDPSLVLASAKTLPTATKSTEASRRVPRPNVPRPQLPARLARSMTNQLARKAVRQRCRSLLQEIRLKMSNPPAMPLSGWWTPTCPFTN